MDEPLSNLDAKLRLEMRSELQRLHLNMGSTFVYVTHDQMEAMTLATRICLIENGTLQQYDAPLDVYNRPNNLFVADFVGSPAINFVEATGEQGADGKMSFDIFDGKKASFSFSVPVNIAEWKANEEKIAAAKEEAHKLARADKKYVEKGNRDTAFKYNIPKSEYEIEEDKPITERDFVFGIRPEAVKICDDGGLDGEIYSAMPTGMETTVRIAIGKFLVTGVVFGGVTYTIGQKVNVSFKGNGIMLFDRKTGKLVGTGELEVK